MTPAQIRKARRTLGLSQNQMAEAVGLRGRDSARTVRRWEHGDFKPSGAVVMIIKQLLKEASA